MATGKAKSSVALLLGILLALAGPAIPGCGVSKEKPTKARIAEGPEANRAFDDLAAFYADPARKPDFARALTDLAARDPAVREKAGAYLLALLKQSLADESNGRAPWKRSAAWGGDMTSPAVEFRRECAEAFGLEATGDECLDAALWLIDVEPLADNQAAGIRALRRIRGVRAEDVFRRLLAQPHPNADVVLETLVEVGKRKLAPLRPQVERLCTHYRTSVREAARATAAVLGVKDLPEYRREEAFTPWLDQQLKDIAAMVFCEVPKDAPWCTVSYQSEYMGEDGKQEIHEVSGWLLEEGAYCRVLDWFGEERFFDAKTSTLKKGSLSDAVTALLAVRAKGDEAVRELSRRGGLTGQFEPRFLRAPEALVTAWCRLRGDARNAARILFPRIDAMSDDRWLVRSMRDNLGTVYHNAMLEAFSHQRDYAAAIRLAKHLSKTVFDGYGYQDRAKELARQLEARRDDFKTFVLPAPDAWAAMRKTLPREKQIVYLAEHLRLLNCIQWGQPGGVNCEERQTGQAPYSGPWGDKSDVRINPYVELLKMKITVGELPALIPFLGDENFMPTFSYWRDFHPSRTLYRVNWLVVGVVNQAAMRVLADLRAYEKLGPAERRTYLEKLTAWCEANKHRRQEELILEAIRGAKTAEEFGMAGESAVRFRVSDAVPVLAGRLPDFPALHPQVSEWSYRIKSPQALQFARRWARSEDGKVRFYAVCILLEQGDRAKAEGLPEIKEILKKDPTWYPLALEPLLAAHGEEAGKLADAILQEKDFKEGWSRSAAILHVLLLGGRTEALAYVVKELDGAASPREFEGEWKGQKVKRMLTRADDMADYVAGWKTDGYRYPTYAPDAERKKAREELKSWLAMQFGRIREGKPHELKTETTPFYHPEWQLDTVWSGSLP